ncbi:GH92 family glycosyl hydrolase [Microbacterium sp.]|uniref:GH92 family glycosyl hydrolase n=1 Tax=Microbacterium sp. TaxID=51671 RepID=UPI0039E5EFA9
MTAHLVPAAGPTDPPSSRPRAGVLGGAVCAYRFDPRQGVQRVRLPMDADRPVADDDLLEWAFYTDDATAPPWASLAVCIDVLFDDGSRLTETAPVDRYGFTVTPAAQFAARWSMPEQWNANAVALAPWAGRRIVAVECVLGDASLAAAGPTAQGFVEVRITQRPALPSSPAERVDTRRGTHSGSRLSRGNTIPAVGMPHGFVFVTPATDAGDCEWPYRYHVYDTEAGRPLEAVQLSHQPSPWIGDRGVLQFMPFRDVPHADRRERRLFVPPGAEHTRPHRYAAHLVDAGGADALDVEATATARTAVLRVRGPGPVGFVIDQHTDHGRLQFAAAGDDVIVSGWVPEGDPSWGNAPRMYYYSVLRAASASSGSLGGAGRGNVAGFVAGAQTAELRVATSFLSVEQARRTLHEEAPWTISFDELVERSRDAWDQACAAIEPVGDDASLAADDLRASIAACLYRLRLYPNAAWERTDDGDAYADPAVPAAAHGEQHTGAPVRAGRLIVNTGYWDTYRTAWPLLFLLDPDGSADLVAGCLAQSASTGWMPRWAAPGPVPSMVGTSSDQVFADAAAWGIGGFDEEAAFETAWRNACEPSPDHRTGRAAVAVSRFTGSVPSEVPESFGWTIEGAISDAAVAAWAARLSERHPSSRAFARSFANRARAYRGLCDGAGFFRSRDGEQRAPRTVLDPAVWGGDYVETNAWGMSVSAVHDGDGLAALHGGPAGLRRHLDALFAAPETADARFAGTYGEVIHEQREARAVRAGMCAMSNQPAHHIAAMHVFGDEPWRAGPLVRELAARLFCGGHIGQGFPGDEDNGEMSAWWLWALIGLYPLVPGSGELLITSPLIDEVVLRPHSDTAFRIVCDRPGPDAHFLAAAELDGAALPGPWVPVAALARAGTLRLRFAAEPDPDALLWRRDETVTPWRPDLARRDRTVAAPGVVGADGVFDDRGIHDVPLAAGAWIGQRFADETRITDVAVTLSGAAEPAALAIEASADGIDWMPVGRTGPATLPAERTTPFVLDDAPARRWWRLRALAPVRLRQLELFDLSGLFGGGAG